MTRLSSDRVKRLFRSRVTNAGLEAAARCHRHFCRNGELQAESNHSARFTLLVGEGSSLGIDRVVRRQTA